MSLILSGTDGVSDIDGSAATPAIRGTDANTGIFFPAADTIAFAEGGAEIARFDSSGNLGIGVTPSAWDTYANNIQTPTGSIVSYSPSSNFGAVQNAYYSSGWKYSTSNFASFYLQSSGVHSWSYASSGTAGNAVTFNEAMRIDSSGNLLFNSGYGSVATAYGCRAWVNFNGTGTVAIRGSGNVSSITDNGTGAYTVNFSTALVDANYCINATGTHDSGSYAAIAYIANDTPPTTSAVRIDCLNTSNTFTDISFAQVAIFR
jgi:hypothetical protein